MLSAAVGLVVFACGACAQQASTTAERGPRLSVAALDLVTTSGGFPARRRVLDMAEEKLVERCMSERGQVYWPMRISPVTATDEERIVDLPKRRVEGFGLATGATKPPSVGPNENQPAFQLALFGDVQHYQGLRLANGKVVSYPTYGCLAQSRAALYGDALRWASIDSVPQVVASTLRAQVKSAPELAEANSRWTSCMGAAGYQYPDPEAAITDLSTAYQQQGKTAALRQREIAVAVADGECALRAHVPSTELALRRSQAQSLPGEQRRELNDLATKHCAAYQNARRVVGETATAQSCTDN